MKSMYNAADAEAILARIHNLNADAQPLWGKMTAAQTVTHLQRPILVALGEMQLKRTLIGILFGKMAKKSFTGSKPFKHNSPTDKNFIVKNHPDFEVEKQKLIALVQRFVSGGPEALSKQPHPFFGPMTPREWDLLQWNHLDHHLRQFGV